MKINAFTNNISFKKTLAANCAVLNQNGQKENCKIYKIDPYEDENYFKDLKNDENWSESEYLPFITWELPFLKKRNNVYEIYSMENSQGKCIGFTELHPDKNSIYIDNLETAPKFVNNKKQSPMKYIGETFLTFVTKLAKKSQKEMVRLNPADTAIGFYSDKCHMDYIDEHVMCILPKERYNMLITQNRFHTGSHIDLAS